MRRVFASVLFILFALCLSAQQLRRDFEREFSVGVNGGLGFSRVSFLHNNTFRMNELGDQTFRMGYRFGVVARYISQKHFGLQLEVNYVRSGWSELYQEDAGQTIVNGYDLQNVTMSRDLHYVEIPILAHIYFGNRKVRFFAELGPELSILTKYGSLEWNISADDERRNAIPNDDPRLYDEHSKVDYGLTGGIGLDFMIGKVHAIIGGRYTYGFNDLYSNTKADIFQRSNNQLINATMSILIPVIKFKEKKR